MFVSFWKRRILVNNFQYRLLVGNFLYLASVVIAFVVVLFAPVVAILADDTVTLAQREVAAHQLLVMHERVWFAIPVVIALCILHAALVSHRIAGPLVRFKRILSDLAAGDLSVKVNIRRHDYLGPEAEVMAEMVAGLRERVGAIRDAYEQAGTTVPQLMHAVGRGANQDAAVLAGKLATQMDVLGREVRQFRTPDARDVDASDARHEPSREGVLTG
jgi:methyl-accepting chemotaxis protein